jgi:hypothetical protein
MYVVQCYGNICYFRPVITNFVTNLLSYHFNIDSHEIFNFKRITEQISVKIGDNFSGIY